MIKNLEQGNAYDKKSILKMYMEYIDNRQTICSVKGRIVMAKLLDFLKKSLYILGVLLAVTNTV